MRTYLLSLLGLLLVGSSYAQVSATYQSSYRTGIFDDSASEIADYDAATQQVFATNSSNNTIDIIDISDITNPTLVSSIDLAPYFGSINSLAVGNGFIAAALEDTIAQNDGRIVFFSTQGTFQSEVQVGALPDMVAISPDGSKAVVALEGEPDDDYLVDPRGGVGIIDLSGGVANLTQAQVTILDFSGLSIDPDVRIFGPGATAVEDLEPEYVTFADNSQTAYVSIQENNAIAIVDLSTNIITSVEPLGYKDHSLANNSLDASNDDFGIKFITQDNLFGMYQPDAIAYYTINGNDYIVTANEGDSRDYNGFSEEARVADVTLDATAFPNAALIQEDSALGRLKITTTLGDTDGDGDYDELYAYGGRSFSIYEVNSTGLTQVYDSGNDFEQRLAVINPANFNSNNDDNTSFDSRSDDKGPEPEAVEIVRDDANVYAFIGLERMGGVFIYNITDPSNVTYVDYFTSRDFSAAEVNCEGLGPEDVIFVPGTESPTGQSLVLVSNEVSGSLDIYTLSGLVNNRALEREPATFKVFPNPVLSDGILHTSKQDDYTVFSTFGQRLFDVQQTNQIDLSKLPEGMYLIQNAAGQVVKVLK